jgi:hypothetical protein
MTSSGFPAFRLPAALSRASSTRSAEAPRHLASPATDAMLRVVVAGPELTRAGPARRAGVEPPAFDPTRDDDPFEWLGFSSARD